MTHESCRNAQNALLEDVVTVLRCDHRVLGVSIAGSLARNASDGFSDIDLNCWLCDEDRNGRTELYERVAGLRPLMCKLWVYDRNALYLFADGLRLDLDFLRPSELGQADLQSNSILHDPDGALARHFRPTRPDTPPDPLRYFADSAALMDWFCWMARQAYCWTGRSETSPVRGYDKLAGSIDSLAQMRCRIVEMRLAMAGRWDYLQRVDPSLAEELGTTFPQFDASAVRQATRRLLEAAKRVGRDYCAARGDPFPASQLDVMSEMLRGFDQLL